MKTPNFWKNKNIVSLILYPLSVIYYGMYKLRVLINASPYKSKIPLICIGNTVTGGAGKTPFAIELGKILNKNKIKFAYLSKGYGGNFEGFMKVNFKKHNSNLVGDESLLLSEISDTFICKNRVDGLKKLNQSGAKYKYIIMDDGLQNPTFKKDFGILVIDGNYGLGNGFILPAGALREGLFDSLKKVQLVILMGKDKFNLRKIIAKNKSVKIIKGEIKEVAKAKFKKNKYVAFSGIARPEKFFDSLKKVGVKVLKKIPFADHYKYSNDDIKNLFDIAKKSKCKLITTKKDWVRIDKKYQSKIEYLDIEIELNNSKIIEKLLVRNDR